MDLKSLVFVMYGQVLQNLLQVFVPVGFLCGLVVFLIAGNLAWISIFLRLAGCLYATMGGLGKISFMFLSYESVFQCFFMIPAHLVMLDCR